MLPYQSSSKIFILKSPAVELDAASESHGCGSTLSAALTAGAAEFVVTNLTGSLNNPATYENAAVPGADDVIVTDLPGIYSLSPYSPEEMVARLYLAEENPDVILNIVDASNLERNLYLTTQLLELGIPVVVALNKADINKKKDTKINKKLIISPPLSFLLPFII